MGTEPSEIELLDDRLAILDALLRALERRGELGDAIAAAADEEAAVSEVQQILGVAREPAIEVLNMSWRRWTSEGRRELAGRRDELQARRDELTSGDGS
jgi:DNA gyrase/topoisomerase IV subunit A